MRLAPAAFMLVLLTAPGALSAPVYYAANLDGPSELPPVPSPGTGSVLMSIDTVAHLLTIEGVTFSGLLGVTTVAHIHCCTAVPFAGNIGVATTTPTFPGFPAGVTAGAYGPMSFDTTLASTWNASFITASGGTPLGAEAALAAGLAAGTAYFNVHTNLFPGGEIRGFLAEVPEPASAPLWTAGLAALWLFRRKLARR